MLRCRTEADRVTAPRRRDTVPAHLARLHEVQTQGGETSQTGHVRHRVEVAVPVRGGDPEHSRDDDHVGCCASASGSGTRRAANRPAAAAARK
jgi:hypothetical protein